MKKRALVSLLLVAGLLAACGAEQVRPLSSDSSSTLSDSAGTESAESVSAAWTDAEQFTDRDRRTSYDDEDAVRILLQGATAACESENVTVDGGTVTIRTEGTYLLSGTLDDGQIRVDAGENDKLQLVFDGVTVSSSSSAALYIRGADKVFVTLAAGSENALSNGGTFVSDGETNVDGAVFSKQDLTCNGDGRLTVTSPGGHGVVCKDDLVLTGGTYTVYAGSHGLDVNDSVRVDGASLSLEAGKDGIHVENEEDESLGYFYLAGGSVSVVSDGDGISASGSVRVSGGDVTVTAGGGHENGPQHTSGGFGGPGRDRVSVSDSDSTESRKAIKADGGLLLDGGTFLLDSADDALHSDGDITVTGGDFTVSSGDDGFHADGTLTVSGGTIRIETSYEGLEGLHVAVSGGNIQLTADDDGVNAAGGTDGSGFGGGFGNDRFGGGRGPGGPTGGTGSSDGSVVISGGTLSVVAYGDGIDSNGSLEITGGDVTVVGPTQGDTATLDFDTTGRITGGRFVGTGGAGMAQTFGDSSQGVVALRVGEQSAGTEIVLSDGGETLLTVSPPLPYAVVILSLPELVKGRTYTVSIGAYTGEFEAS